MKYAKFEFQSLKVKSDTVSAAEVRLKQETIQVDKK